ncbi:aminoglycoside phosphotransferase family protein [Bacillus anthracis]|uniref:phosphotransferase family protein n=1 Tax=Bacillus anthracis TaxID=1392 RepID=UPI002DBE8B01|nr:aminoglycoside phosphotransferase family protein [Bacillus anthracis]MEB9507354.1 aminoglycoside phosphotransferase family protein [Bacillus anthracis]
MFSIDFYINEIKQNEPSINIETIHILGEGMRSIVFDVNNKWAFRFAKNNVSSLDLIKEMKILPYINSKVSLAIPTFDFVGKQTNGLYYVGYEKLPGELLEEDAIEKLNQFQVQNLNLSLSQFIRQLHSISIDASIHQAVPKVNLKDKIIKLYKEANEKVFPLLDEKTKEYISGRIYNYLNNQHYHIYNPKLIHGDLSPDHFLINPKTGTLTGIIDFGDLCICDPDYEFIYIMEDCGKAFTRDLLASLRYSKVDETLTKISYFVTFDQIQYTLDGIIRNQNDWIEEGLYELRKDMEANTEL